METARATTWLGCRTMILAELAPYLPQEEQPGVLIESLRAAILIQDEIRRPHVLTALAPMLSKPCSDSTLFILTLYFLAQRGRPALLSDLTALAPWIIALAEHYGQPAVPAALAEAVVDVERCWP